MALAKFSELLKLVDGPPLAKPIVRKYGEGSIILQYCGIETKSGDTWKYPEEGQYASTATRNPGASYTASSAVFNEVQESKCQLGGELDVDTAFIMAHGYEARAEHVASKTTSLAKNLDKLFLKGDSATTSSEPDGLQVRITESSQKIAAGATSGGDALSLAKLIQAKAAVYNPTHWIMGKDILARLSTAAHATSVGGYLHWGKDDFGREVQMIDGLPIIAMDVDGTMAKILDFNEANPGGGSSVGTSIYCVSFNYDNGIRIVQSGPPVVTDFGQVSSSPVYKTRIEWQFGFQVPTRSCARVWGIKDDTVAV